MRFRPTMSGMRMKLGMGSKIADTGALTPKSNAQFAQPIEASLGKPTVRERVQMKLGRSDRGESGQPAERGTVREAWQERRRGNEAARETPTTQAERDYQARVEESRRGEATNPTTQRYEEAAERAANEVRILQDYTARQQAEQTGGGTQGGTVSGDSSAKAGQEAQGVSEQALAKVEAIQQMAESPGGFSNTDMQILRSQENTPGTGGASTGGRGSQSGTPDNSAAAGARNNPGGGAAGGGGNSGNAGRRGGGTTGGGGNSGNAGRRGGGTTGGGGNSGNGGSGGNQGDPGKFQAPRRGEVLGREGLRAKRLGEMRRQEENGRPSADDVSMARTWNKAMEPVESVIQNGNIERQRFEAALKAVDPNQPGLSKKQSLEYTQRSAQIKRDMAEFEREQGARQGETGRKAFDALAIENDIDAGLRNKDASKADARLLKAADQEASARLGDDFQSHLRGVHSGGAVSPEASHRQGGHRPDGTQQASSGEVTGDKLAQALDKYTKVLEKDVAAKLAIADMPGTQRRDDSNAAREYRKMGIDYELRMIDAGERRAANLENQANNMMNNALRQEMLMTQRQMMRAMILSNAFGNLNNVANQLTSMAGAVGARAAQGTV